MIEYFRGPWPPIASAGIVLVVALICGAHLILSKSEVGVEVASSTTTTNSASLIMEEPYTPPVQWTRPSD